MLYWRRLGRLSKASALREASMQVLEMLNWSVASLARWLGDLLRLAVRTRSVVQLVVLRGKWKVVLVEALGMGVLVALNLAHLADSISTQIDFGLVSIQFRVDITEGRIQHILARLRKLLIQRERAMASMERRLAGGSGMKAAAQVGICIPLVRCLKEAGRGGILRI